MLLFINMYLQTYINMLYIFWIYEQSKHVFQDFYTTGTICQPSNKTIVFQNVMETVSNEFNCFFFIIFQVPFEFH